MTHTKISKSKSAELIRKGMSENKILVATVKKKNGEKRTITFRYSPLVKEGTPTPPEEKKAKAKASKLGYALVWDIQKEDWRHINLQNVERLETGKNSYLVS